MEVTEAAVIASAATSAVSATAAAISARASRQAVTRAHRPFVWAEIHVVSGRSEKEWVAKVRLHNDGPGSAFDVSAAVGPDYVYERARRSWWRLWERALLGYATPPIRAMRPGEAVPPRDTDDDLYALVIGSIEDWWVAVRYTDAAGMRWEFREPRSPESLAAPPRRLRARWWQLRRPPRWW